MYKLSKAVKDGELVSLRGDKFIRCSRFATPRGVYTKGLFRKTLTLNGDVVTTEAPSGIAVYGEIGVRAAGDNQ